MPSHTFHLAEINIAKMRYPLEDTRMADFAAALDEINSLAEESPGFVWRLKSDDGDATALRVFDDPNTLINMSVWESVEALFDYTYRSGHTGFFKDRQRWFYMPESPHLAMWWQPAGHEPTIEEAKARLDHLQKHGPSPTAFSFKQRFPAPDPQSS
jgi:hypothetical protein